MSVVDVLLREMDDAWHTFNQALKNLSDAEYWWEPAPNAWTLREVDGRWRYDYDLPEPRPAGPERVPFYASFTSRERIVR